MIKINGIDTQDISKINGINIDDIFAFNGVTILGQTVPPDMNLDAKNSVSYPGSGTTWFDIAGNRDGTINGASFVSSSPKNFSFDGVNDYVSFDYEEMPDLFLTGVTFSFWIKTNTTSDRDIIGTFNDGFTTGFQIVTNNTGVNNVQEATVLWVRSNNGIARAHYMNENIYDNAWHHVVVSVGDVRGTNVSWYVDGVAALTTSANVGVGTFSTVSDFQYPVYLMAGNNRNSTTIYRACPGNLSQFTIHAEQLTGSQITAIFNNQKSTYGL